MTAQDIVPAPVAPNATDELAQHLVSRLVTVCVVDLLEMINVADPHSQVVVVPTLPGKLAGKGDTERPAIENTGQGIVHGFVGECISSFAQSRLQLDHAPAHVNSG